MALRSERFPLERLRALLRSPRFDRSAWEGATSPHLHLRIGSRPPRLGQAASLDALEELLARIIGIGVSFCDSWVLRGTIIAETELSCATPAGPAAIPCTLIVRSSHGVIVDMRFYLDCTPFPPEAWSVTRRWCGE
ncbi:hypothetical protein J4558_06070 [Leptolyngbya sp. 15MV]|nr:hypothetical protein J4558_06070 [Leptolyngbya sp. 15MV]